MKTKLTYLFITLLVPLYSFAFLPTLSYQNTSIVYGDVTRIRATATSQNSTYALQNIPSALVGHISVNINNGDINVESTAPAGVYTITNRATDNSGSTDASFTLTISKAPLTITGQNKTITYCDAFPVCAASYSGFKNNDNAGSLTGTLICDYGTTAPAPAGSYVNNLNTSTLSSPNYTITYVNGSLLVDKSPTSVVLTQTNANILVGQSVTYSASINSNKTCVATGSVVFTIDGIEQTAVTVNNVGVATLTITNFAVGVHTVFATYSGSVNQLSSFSTSLSTTVCPIITLGGISNGTMNIAYNQTVSISPADAYTFSIPIGQLPKGLILNTSTGQISGTPSEAGIFNFTVVAKNGIACSKSKEIVLKIAGNNCLGRHFDPSSASPIATGSVPQAFTPQSAAGDYHLATADFNNDGILDIIIPSKNGTTAAYSLFLGNGNGGFTGGTPISTRASLGNNIPVVAADFDNDGDKDVIMAESDFGDLIILINDGLGNFTVSTTTYNTIRTPTSAATGDFNQDGKPDVAITMAVSNRVQIFLNTTVGGVVSFSNLVAVNTDLLPRSIVLGKFNTDDFLDIATANYTTNNVSVAFGTGTGSFSVATEYVVGLNCRDIATGDFDNDGDFDLVTANYGESTLSILTNNGNGVFGVTAKTVAAKMNGVTVNDFNADGFYDILATSQQIISPANTQSYAYLLYNNGSGSFITPTALGTDYFSVGLQPGSLISGDFNQDGSLDFISANIGSNGNTGSLSILLNNCPPVATNFSLNHGIGVSTNTKILTAFDGNQTVNTLIAKVNGTTSATQNGITISNLSVNSNGEIMADVAASCSATNTTFSISVTDNFNKTSTATLSINIVSGPIISTPPTNKTTCDATQINIPIAVTGLGLTYQWQFSSDSGQTYNNVPNTTPYTGISSDNLIILANAALNNYKYKCLITGACSAIETNAITLSVQSSPITLGGNVSGGTTQVYHATQVTSTQKLAATSQIEYRAGKSITLNSGFSADSQSIFIANIIGCQ
ncbi:MULTISPECIES: FG-GAP-like repeat-containing protein [Emticicia]|uniref:FG-GAP-like repeat-containing protein n=1 Tax=Emticicia TaxID=312278 RepID=UPI0018D38744|nr:MULTISPECIES: FG-GAP-like repeat-containing protein [Emticicia]